MNNDLRISLEPATKPGKSTTEFGLVLLANLITAGLAFADQLPGVWGVVLVVILNGLYATLRSAIKNKLIDTIKNIENSDRIERSTFHQSSFTPSDTSSRSEASSSSSS